MAQTIRFYFILIFAISLLSGHLSYPIPNNGLIEGSEFLSIFINHGASPADNKPIIDELLPERVSERSIHNEVNDHEVRGKDKTDKSNIVQLVTSGSKIVFPEEVQPETKKVGRVLKSDPVADIDDFKVISVSVSSSETTSQQKPINNRMFQPIADTIVDIKNVIDTKDPTDNFQSNSRKSDFSIEEKDPFTQAMESQDNDSFKEESVHVQSIVLPSQLNGMSKSEQSNSENQPLPYSPIQSLIIHDQDYNNGGGSNARPRSVSYSSITQAINNGDQWNDKHDKLIEPKNDSQPNYTSQPEMVYSQPAKQYSEAAKVYGEPSKYYSEPSKIYSEPAKIYGEPERIYSEPAKIYSKPAQVYSEPARIYSEPAKIYSEPSKVYGIPSKVYSKAPTITTTTISPSVRPTTKRIVFNLDKLPYDLLNAPVDDDNSQNIEIRKISQHPQFHPHRNHTANESEDRPTTTTIRSRITNPPYNPTPEQNYEIDEAVSVHSNGRVHGVQSAINNPQSTTALPMIDPKTGYVVEGRNFRKYRVEEKTPDGFIVGEYGVVSNDDGSLRGVRYTADSNINPNLIYEALMKFLSL